MRYILRGDLGGDPTNFWVPNIFCLGRILTHSGFKNIELNLNPFTSAYGDYAHHIVHATR